MCNFLNNFFSHSVTGGCQLLHSTRFTCPGDEGFCPAAAEALQQGPGADVGVEQRSGAAQFGKSEPNPDEVGFVPEEHSHSVSLLQLGVMEQSPRQFTAQLIRLAVRVGATFKHQELLLRMLLHRV